MEGVKFAQTMVRKFADRISGRLYNEYIAEKLSDFAVRDTVCFIHHLSCLSFVPYEDGFCFEESAAEPKPAQIDSLAGEKVEVNPDFSLQQVQVRASPVRSKTHTKSRFSIGRKTKVSEIHSKSPQKQLAVPLQKKEAKNIELSLEQKVEEAVIDRLRSTFLARNLNKQREEESLRKEMEQQNATSDKVKEIHKKYKDFSMDISGSICPVKSIPPKKLIKIHSFCTARVAENANICSASLLPLIYSSEKHKLGQRKGLDTHNNYIAQSRESLNKKFDVTAKEKKQLADLSGIEPSFGVTYRVSGEGRAKKGPSFRDRSSGMIKSQVGFTQIQQYKMLSDNKAVTSSQLIGNKQETAQKTKEDNAGSILLVQSNLKQQLRYYRGNTANSNPGVLPSTSARYIRKSQLRTELAHPRVIVEPEKLRKSLEQIESKVVTRPKSVLQSRFSIKHYTSEKRLHDSHPTKVSQSRVAPHPIGKTAGNGIIRNNIIN